MNRANQPQGVEPSREWAEVFRQHRGWLGTVVRSRMPDAHEAADVLQEIAVELLKRSDSPVSIERLEPWLYRIALRRILQYRRLKGRARRRDDQWAAQREASSEPAPLDWVLRQESRQLVNRELARLRDGDRDILMLKLVERWSYERIARHLGLTRHAVEYRLERARNEMRHRLNESVEAPMGKVD